MFQDKINWSYLSKNVEAISLLKRNMDKICWINFCSNTNPEIIHILEENQHRIVWYKLSENPIIFELNYDFFVQRMNVIRQELMEKTWNIQRYQHWCLSIDET